MFAASKHFLPAILFTVCFGVYVGNGDFLPGNDQVGNMLFSVNLLKRHSFAISPPVAPQAFFWTIAKPGQEPVPTAIDEWTESTSAAYREGRLAATSHFYYVSPTAVPGGVRQHVRCRRAVGRAAGVRRARPVRRYRTRPFLVVARRCPHRVPARAGGAVRVPGGARLRPTGAGCSDRARVRPGKLRVAGQQHRSATAACRPSTSTCAAFSTRSRNRVAEATDAGRPVEHQVGDRDGQSHHEQSRHPQQIGHRHAIPVPTSAR